MAAKTPHELKQAWRTVRSVGGFEIFMKFDIGSPGQTLNILLDSGSDWFWVAGERCYACNGVTNYDQRISNSFSLVEEDGVYLEYGSGALLGDHIQETVCLSMARGCEGQFCSDVCV